MSRPYHSVATRTEGRWSIEFGSYVKSEVRSEAEELRSHHRVKDIYIFQSGDRQCDIDAALAHLNTMSSEIVL